jgi:hypothetical protein
VEEVQSIEFKDADSKNLNKDIKETRSTLPLPQKLRKRGN